MGAFTIAQRKLAARERCLAELRASIEAWNAAALRGDPVGDLFNDLTRAATACGWRRPRHGDVFDWSIALLSERASAA